MEPCVTFSGIKVEIFDSYALVYICLHLSSDWYTLVYTRLVTRLHLSIFLYIHLWLVYIRLHSSKFVYLFILFILFLFKSLFTIGTQN